MTADRGPFRPATAGQIAVPAVLVAMLLVADRAPATPPGITFVSITPSNGNTLFVARTAANNPLDPPTFQLKADVFFDNFSGAEAEVTDVTFRYPGSSIPEMSNTPKLPGTTANWKLAQGANQRVAIHHGLDVDLPTPLPATVEIDFEFNADGAPLTLTFNIAFYENAVPLGALFFPARAEDLEEGEYWFWYSSHVAETGAEGTGRYAMDMGVTAWSGFAWSDVAGGKRNENADFRVWNKPLYAMGDGVVVACYRGEPDEPPAGFDEVEYYFGWGNSLFIQYGGDLVGIGHMQNGTIPERLCPAPASPGPGVWPSTEPQAGLNIPVEAGEYLGRVGNTGRSTAPHIHFQVEGNPSISGAPMQFLNVRAIAGDTSLDELGGSSTLRPLHKMILHRNALVLPNPCGFDLPPTGALEVSRHGVPAECYQDVFNMVAARGYAPKFVDGYDAGGQTYFNATFQPTDTAWVARHGLTGAQYQELFDDLTGEGYRLHQVDSYLQGGSPRYAAIFESRPGHPFAAFHGLGAADYAARVGTLQSDGYVPVNLSTVEVEGALYWTGLFEKVNDTRWTIQSVPVANYQDVFDDNVGAGRLPIHVNGYNAGWQPFLTGIWVDPMGGSWAAVHDRSGAQYQADWVANTGAGRFTRYTSGYDDGTGVQRFAAVWRGRPNTVITSAPADKTNETAAMFTLASDNPLSTFECSIDAGAFEPCTSPKHITGLSEGSHTFAVRALDRERVRDSSPASFTWLVDVTPPEVAILEPLSDAKTVNGVLKEDPVDITTVVGWAGVAARVTDELSGVDGVVFKVDGVQVPGTAISVVGRIWRFEFIPDQKNQHIYTIEAIATDRAGNSATASMEVLGIKTMKPR